MTSQNDESAPKETQEPQQKKHSGLALASFIISFIVMLLYIALFVLAGYFQTTRTGLTEQSPEMVFTGIGIIGAGIINLIGIGLGIAGSAQKEYKKILGILGLIFNISLLLVVAAIIAIGVTIGS